MEIPVIKNIEELSTSKLRKDTLDILEVGYESISTERLIRSKIKVEGGDICIKDERICLDDYERIFLVAIGKCAVDSATVLEKILGDKIVGGIVLDIKKGKFRRLISEIGTHPFPSEQNVFITKSITQILKKATKKDLILTIISGGGSSLMTLPLNMSYGDQKKITEELMNKGANIMELNTIRKHTSAIKGGHFAEMAYPARVISLIISDVPGDDLSIIASGPTVMDKTTIKDAKKILIKYGLKDKISLLHETPKKTKFFENVTNILLGTNLVFLEASKKRAEELGYDTYIEDTKIQGEARVLGEELASKEFLASSCHLWGGETTVKVLNKGVGGRNQEFVLGGLSSIDEYSLIAGVASDGWDNSDVAGALGDKDLYEKSLDENLDLNDYLDRNDSYHFFKKVGGHIVTNPTGSNVADIYLIIKGNNKK